MDGWLYGWPVSKACTTQCVHSVSTNSWPAVVIVFGVHCALSWRQLFPTICCRIRKVSQISTIKHIYRSVPTGQLRCIIQLTFQNSLLVGILCKGLTRLRLVFISNNDWKGSSSVRKNVQHHRFTDNVAKTIDITLRHEFVDIRLPLNDNLKFHMMNNYTP